jgi:predicted ATPase/DNA-binding CsgD family transcriptional regulator
LGIAVTGAERLAAGDATLTLLPSGGGQHNLPVQLTSFVGREAELAEVGRLLADERLVTLTGAGGCGKTRLALRAAGEFVERFPDGVWWVELAPLAEERLVGAAVAESLGVRPLPGMTELQACGGYLASRRALLVLDNCEHLVEACAAAVDSLLKVAPGLVVLATSRAALGVGGETDWRVPSLSLPADGSGDGIAGSDAVALFLERAGKARPGFQATDSDVVVVGTICTRLDGLPLAIELAAARVRMLSLEQIAAGLADRFRLLTGGPRTATPRLQTLRASVDWSHDLLSTDEQTLLRRLSVFGGGFTLGSVERVCAGGGLDGERVLDLLGSLVDQSLVLAEERDSVVRYRMLETVRQYGLERLDEAREERVLRDRHRDAFLELAEQAGPHLKTGRQAQWLMLLDPETANLAAAIDHAVASEPALALRLCAALHMWWRARGRLAEGELAQSRALDACGEREPALRARVLCGRANIANYAGRFDAEGAHATEALALAEEVGDQGTAAWARGQLAGPVLFTNPAASRAELARAAELAREAGDDWWLVVVRVLIGQSYLLQGDHVRGAEIIDEFAAQSEAVGEPLQVAFRWLWIAWMAQFDGRLAKAREAAEQARGAVSAVDAPIIEAFAAVFTAFADVWEGEPERALARLHAPLERVLKLGAWLAVPWLLVAIALAELASGRHEQARDRLEALLPRIEGRDAHVTSWTLAVLAEARRLHGDGDAESVALRAQATGEQLGNRLVATFARLTLGRLAAARGEWTAARRHALAHLDACAEGGHATFIPACLDALGEVAAGLGFDRDAVRLLAAAERARAEIGVARFLSSERQHWAAIDARLRDTLGDGAYEQARAEGAGLGIEDALEWARRTRGPRDRPAGGWASLTPTEARVAELVSEGLTNPQIGERMFISRETVKTHLAHIFRKLGVGNRAELSALVGRQERTS